jgi:hypothetical protein
MLFVAELTWRWAFAAGAIGILLFYSAILRDAISLSAADQNALLSSDPVQIISTGTKILAGALPSFVQAATGALPKIAFLWWLCITIGRARILRSIVAPAAAPTDGSFWMSMVLVHGVRVVLLLIPVSAYLFATRTSTAVMGDPENPQLLSAMIVFLAIFATGLALWSLANFVASLAPLFVAGKRRPWLDSLADALSVSIARRKDFFAVASMNAVIRTVIALAITVASLLLIPLASFLPAFFIGSLAVLLTVLYCAASDYLLLARTASYAVLALSEPSLPSAPISRRPQTPLYSAPPDLRS